MPGSDQLVDQSQVQELIRQLGSIVPSRRRYAVEQLRAAGPDVTEALLEAWNAANARPNIWWSQLPGAVAMGISLFTLLRFSGLLRLIGTSPSLDPAIGLPTLWPACAASVLATCIAAVLPLARLARMSAIADALAGARDLRALDAILLSVFTRKGLPWNEKADRPDIESAAAVISTITPERAHQLSSIGRKAVGAWLNSLALHKDQPVECDAVTVAALRTVAAAGITEALGSVRRIAATRSTHPDDALVIATAAEVLPELERLAASKTDALALLRGSAATHSTDNLLLHSGRTGEQGDTHLLRPDVVAVQEISAVPGEKE